jgi:N-sulfoglucosamine sulfohydrolase
VVTHLDRSRAVVDERFHYIRNYMPDQPGFFPAGLYQQVDISYDEVLVEMLRLRAEGKLTPEQEQIIAETRPVEELFDIEKDPHQLKNLAEDPDLLPVLRQMRTALELWLGQTQDKGFLPEPPEGAQKGAFLVDFWMQTTGGKYNVDDYGVYELPAAPEFAKLLQ